ncbi:MAG: ribbon-helix-helix domain-containing protein [bacterium]
MLRTQVYLTEDQLKKGKKIAKVIGKSFSDLVRISLDEGIEKYLNLPKNKVHPLAKFSGSLPAVVVDQAVNFVNKNKKSRPIYNFEN